MISLLLVCNIVSKIYLLVGLRHDELGATTIYSCSDIVSSFNFIMMCEVMSGITLYSILTSAENAARAADFAVLVSAPSADRRQSRMAPLDPSV